MNNYQKSDIPKKLDCIHAIRERKRKYGLIIPCFNEELRFPYQQFFAFARKYPEILICFVNDGSSDRTLSILKDLQNKCPFNVCVLSLEENSGKSEAVRQGLMYVNGNFDVTYLGYLDADMATTAEEWLEMARYKQNYPQYGAIVGSRIQRLGVKIDRDEHRSLFSGIIKKMIRFVLQTPFYDTQCGAKIFHKSLIRFLFERPFLTPWLFDVEIFLRLQQKFGKSTLQNGVLEYPLMQWTEVSGSKLKLMDGVKTPFQLFWLYVKYHLAYPSKLAKNNFSAN